MRGMRANSPTPPASTVMSTLRREPMRSLTMPQKETEAMGEDGGQGVEKPQAERL